MFENGIVQTVGLTMTEILTPVKTFWPQDLRCQSVERPDDQNRFTLLRQVRNPARERSRNLNREVWESPSVYGGEDVKRRLMVRFVVSMPSFFLVWIVTESNLFKYISLGGSTVKIDYTKLKFCK
jgi:hypothetical protein